MPKRQIDPDQNIIKALKELKLPLFNFDGTKIYFQKRKRYETVYEHIASKHHHLKIKDISLIPTILLSKNDSYTDPKTKKSILYYGKRKGVEKQNPWLKIICNKTKDGNQEISNIYPVRKYKG